MARTKYAGTWTAIITPFNEDSSVDEISLRKIVRRQVENGVTGVVPVGTTGESPTTTYEEDKRIFEVTIDEVKKSNEEFGRSAMVMAGTGSNSTMDAIKYTEAAKDAGADCCLVVAPYYNKPTPEGLRRHYKAIASVGLPVIVYNIKGRTGINIDTDTLMDIAEHHMIVGVKEASGDIEQMKDVLARRPDDFAVLSGDDVITLDLIRAGGDGVISVSSNVVPDKVSEMVQYALEGNWEEAEKLGEEYARMFDELFCETNPIPVKYCVAKMGLCELSYRLPMVEPSEKAIMILDEMMEHYGLS
ncbi:MAG: 4-hydroxy-tetrahydrodipicolinate synthase [bacterium]|nr:4-hydroxy-tetrahydrodipicolinate synthase [bacterium]